MTICKKTQRKIVLRHIFSSNKDVKEPEQNIQKPWAASLSLFSKWLKNPNWKKSDFPHLSVWRNLLRCSLSNNLTRLLLWSTAQLSTSDSSADRTFFGSRNRKEQMLQILKARLNQNMHLYNHKHFSVCRPVPVHPPFRPNVGIWGEEPRSVHDGDAPGAEDEEGLDAHGTKAVGPLWSRWASCLPSVLPRTVLISGEWCWQPACHQRIPVSSPLRRESD